MKFHLYLPLLALGFLSSCSKKAAPASTSSHGLKTADFPAFIANPGTLNIVDFSATWCPPCQQLKPVLASIADEYSDTVRLGVVDVDTENSLAAQQGVRGIPDVRFFIDGKQVDKFSGAVPKEHIEQLIAKHSKKLIPADTGKTTPPSTSEEPTAPAAPVSPEQPAVAPPHPDLVAPPPQSSAPAASSNPTIIPTKENPLPPGMSKQ
ncbi:MAG: thioredoxin domain-containing protein [Verrucomicrobiota bacterium]